MPEALAPDMRQFTQAASDFSFLRNYGDPIRDPPSVYYPPPQTLYLVYLEFYSGKLIARELFAPQLGATLEATETNLFDKAKADDAVLATNFRGLAWNQPCYLTFVIDNTDWKFYWRDTPKKHDGIVFLQTKDILTGPAKTYVQNKSFYNAKHIKVKDGNGIEHDAIRCENYIRDGNGNAIPPSQWVDYCFEIYVEAPYYLQGLDSHVTMIIDPDGQNQGPRTA